MRFSDYLAKSLSFQIVQKGRAMAALFDQYLEEFGLSYTEAMVLLSIYFEQEVVQPKQITELFAMSKANTSHTVSHLESKKLIRRKTNTQDSRKFDVIISEKGKRLCHEITGRFNRLEEGVEKTLSNPEQADWVEKTQLALDAHYRLMSRPG